MYKVYSINESGDGGFALVLASMHCLLNSQKWIKSKRKCVNLEWEFGENEVPDGMRCLHGACRETSIGRVVYFSTKDA